MFLVTSSLTDYVQSEQRYFSNKPVWKVRAALGSRTGMSYLLDALGFPAPDDLIK